MSKKFLNDFNPKTVAYHEYRMWRFYYQHNFFRLFIELIAFFRSYFGLSFFAVFLPAYYAASAATHFRRCKGRETAEDIKKILRSLELFYKIISRKSSKALNYKRLAELELYWWHVDRYPKKFTESRAEAISRWAAELFGVESILCNEFAVYRSRAMELQDLYEMGDVDAINWNEIQVLLEKSYSSLHKNIQ